MIRLEPKGVDLISKAENQSIWETRISDQQASGLTQREWCVKSDINLHNFRYWKRRLGVIESESSTKQRFVSISPIPVHPVAPIQLRMGKLTVEVQGGVDLGLLDDVLKVLMRYA